MVQEMFLHLLQGSARATYLLDFNFVDIATCFASLAAAEDDRHSNCENSTTSDVLNSTEHPGIFSFRCWICIGLGSLKFGLFAGCFNSHLVCLDQCWETSFYFRALSTCWVIYSLLFSHVFLFFSAILRCALLCYCSCACFLGYLVNQLFYIFEHLFILVEDRLVKILSFCVFVSPGDVAFLLKRGT